MVCSNSNKAVSIDRGGSRKLPNQEPASIATLALLISVMLDSMMGHEDGNLRELG